MTPTRFGSLLLVASCGSILASCAPDDGRIPVVVYSPHGEDILREFEKMFEEANPGIDVRGTNMPSTPCLARAGAERENPSCDVWWGAPDNTFARAAGENLLEAYRPTFVDLLPAGTCDPEFRFCGQFAIPQIILFNKDKLTPGEVPQHWAELATEAWKGRVILRAPLDSGSMRTSFSWLIAYQSQAQSQAAGSESFDAGIEWLKGLTRNTKKITTNPTEMFEAITKDVDRVVTIWNLADAIFQRDTNGYPFATAIPSEGVPMVIDGIALVKKSKPDPARLDAAKRFYEFVNTLESQQYLAQKHGRIPLRTDFTAEMRADWAKGLDLKPLPIDPKIAAKHEDEWMRLWDERIKPLANS